MVMNDKMEKNNMTGYRSMCYIIKRNFEVGK